MKHLRTTAILLGLVGYLVAFTLTPLPSMTEDASRPVLRLTLLVWILIDPYRCLLSNWFGAPPQFTFGDRLPILLAAGLILAWAAALGWLLLAALRADRKLTRLETGVFSTAVGLSALSTWTLLMGLLGWLNCTWVFVVPASLTFIGTGIVWRLRLGLHSSTNSRGPTARGTFFSEKAPGPELLDARWLWLGLPFVLVILLAAMLPPAEFDVCEYHLQAPKEFFQQGQITFLPHNVYANMPLGAEMLALLAMVLTGDWWLGALVGKTVIAAFTPLCALGLFAAGRRFYSTTAGIVAALVYISIPWVVSVSSIGLIDGALACYLFLALYALLLSNEPSEASDRSSAAASPTALVVLAGYLAGGAAATKYPAVLFVLLPLAVWLFVAQFKRPGAGDARSESKKRGAGATPSSSLDPQLRFSRAIAVVTLFLVASAVGCGLWFGKNWALTGNPTYPLLYGVFDGKTWTAAKEQQWNGVHRPHDFSVEALGSDLGRVALTSEWLSPLVVPLAVLAFLGWGEKSSAASRKRRWGLLAYGLFVIAAWWLLTHRIDRFWIPVLPVLALLAGEGACRNPSHWWRGALMGLLGFGLAANFLTASAGLNNAWFVPLGELRTASPHWIAPWHWYLNNSPAPGAVLAVGDAAVFNLNSPVLYNTCFDDCIFEQLVKGKTGDEIRAEFASRHIGRVYVNWSEIERYREPGNYGFSDFVQPGVFDRLVEQGVLEPEQSHPDIPGQVYRVKP
jgi:hypothetical protein